MEPEGMVHALEITHQLVKPDGCLIDIHPTGDPPPISVRIGEQSILVGWLREADDFVEYEQAELALQKAVEDGIFEFERRGAFTFDIFADTIVELQEHLAEEWQDAIIDDIIIARASELMNTVVRDSEVLLKESVSISRLRPLHSFG